MTDHRYRPHTVSAPVQHQIDRHLGDLQKKKPHPIAPAAWFLGPNAENETILKHLITHAIDTHCKFRQDYAPDDPNFVDAKTLKSKAFRQTSDDLRKRLSEVTTRLRGSIPLSSYRNQSHMYWDITLPAVAGYLGGMLYNQNNVAAEASPVTTAFEIQVASELCRMLGYKTPDDCADIPKPWGHITCDGSVANLEAMWAARNLKYLPGALARGIKDDDDMAPATSVTVRTGTGQRERLMDLTDWERLNLPIAEVLSLSERISETCGIPMETIAASLDRHSVQATGLLDFHQNNFVTSVPSPVVIVPATAHYSWAKAGAILGLGVNNIRPVPVDLEARMDTVELRRALDACLAEERPVIQVVAVMGTTTEGAVDPISRIAEIREEYRELGLEFAIHADAAWGGYFASLLRTPKHPGTMPGKSPPLGGFPSSVFTDHPEEHVSDYVRHELGAMALADSITVDPHKAGFIPYPAGALCYRDEAMPQLIKYTAPVVYHGGTAPTVGVYGVEGSKPGASPTAVHLSHDAIPPDQSGYGQLLGRCVFNAKRFYAAMITMAKPDDPFALIPFKRLPAEKAGEPPKVVERQIKEIRDRVTGFENEQLIAELESDKALFELFQALGPDLTVFAYAFNFRTANGWNPDQNLMNELNALIFSRCSIEHEGKPGQLPKAEIFVTSSAFDPRVHSHDLMANFAARAHIDLIDNTPIDYLISTMQNPWLSHTENGNFIPHLMAIYRDILLKAVSDIIKRHGLKPIK